ncbi:hypothetical protein [Cedecea sp. NFIX57]|uniref:hypothetical protein n=1 Tax=Cedecea sp. NFIX57 TaxID=1566286 RepID=UPI00111C5EF6|nr:hypothetical protein [Cedecea sp. NFIX57]
MTHNLMPSVEYALRWLGWGVLWLVILPQVAMMPATLLGFWSSHPECDPMRFYVVFWLLMAPVCAILGRVAGWRLPRQPGGKHHAA